MTARGPLAGPVVGSPDPPAHVGQNTARRVIPLFRPYRLQVAFVVGLIVLTSTVGIVNPLLIQAVFNKALFPPGGRPTMMISVIPARPGRRRAQPGRFPPATAIPQATDRLTAESSGRPSRRANPA